MTPTPPPAAPRRGVTLIELLVVMAILTGLLALALMLIPNINNQNATLKGAGEVQAALKTAQGMAAAARMPRGVRFVVSTKLNGYVATEMQYLETPPIIVSDPQALVAKPNDPAGVTTPFGPRVELVYTLAGPPGANAADPPQGTIINRRCFVRGLTQEQAEQVTVGSTLVMPTLGAWSRVGALAWILPVPPATSPVVPPSPGPYTYVLPNPPYPPRTPAPLADLELALDVYPDALLGVATSYRTYHFGIYGTPIPLLAEGTVPLPKDIGVDLQVSYPPLPPVGARKATDYDIMFSPDGPTISTLSTSANANVYLWVRDYTKITNPAGPVTTTMFPGDFQSYAAYVDAFRRGGEQYAVGVRAGGFVGAAPVLPAPAGGSFPHDPFALARQQLDK